MTFYNTFKSPVFSLLINTEVQCSYFGSSFLMRTAISLIFFIAYNESRKHPEYKNQIDTAIILHRKFLQIKKAANSLFKLDKLFQSNQQSYQIDSLSVTLDNNPRVNSFFNKRFCHF